MPGGTRLAAPRSGRGPGLGLRPMADYAEAMFERYHDRIEESVLVGR